MAKFIFKTMSQSIASYTSPVSMISYDIMRNQPFEVTNKEDIEFFSKNKRFKKAGVFSKLKADKTNPEDEFRKELLEVEGLGEDTAELVVKIYRSKKDFLEVLEQDLPLDRDISEEEQEILKSKFLKLEGDFEEEESEDYDPTLDFNKDGKNDSKDASLGAKAMNKVKQSKKSDKAKKNKGGN